MKFASVTRNLAVLAVAGLVPVAFASGSSRDHASVQKEAVKLIAVIEDASKMISYHTNTLASFAGTLNYSRDTHVHYLEKIKEQINNRLRPAAVRLAAIQPQLPDWKQDNIDRILAAARALAQDTNAAITVKVNTSPLLSGVNPEYRKLLARMSTSATDLSKTSDAAGSYVAARMKAADVGVSVPGL